MRAIYRGHLSTITDDTGDGVVLDDDMWVPFNDPDLVIDPTDDEVDAAHSSRISTMARRGMTMQPRTLAEVSCFEEQTTT